MNKFKLLLAFPLLILVACTPIEKNARDTSAALKGAIESAQTKYLTSCTVDKTQAPCIAINKSVAGQNALITSIQAYCSYSVNTPPADPNAKCVPVASAKAGLETAVANATQFISELKGVL